MAGETKSKDKEPVNIVHQNAIFCETVHKEQKHQKLYTNFSINPYKKSESINGRQSNNIISSTSARIDWQA
jgi:hypothetical protein